MSATRRWLSAARRWLPAGGAAVILAVVLWCVWGSRAPAYELASDAKDGAYEATVSPDVQRMAEELESQRQAALDSAVEIQINGEPTVDAASGRCNLLAGNPSANERDMRVTLTLDADGQILWQSGVLKPGERNAYVTLDTVPPAGGHAATAEFAVLDPATGEAVGAVDAGVWLTVQ